MNDVGTVSETPSPPLGAELVPLPPAMPIETNPALLYLAGLTSKASRASMRGALACIARLIKIPGTDFASIRWDLLTRAHVLMIKNALSKQYSVATANHALAAIRGVMREAWRAGKMDPDAYAHAVDVPDVKGSRLLAGRAVPPEELRQFAETVCAGGGAVTVRNMAILGVLCGGGLRRNEIVGLDFKDWQSGGRVLRVLGKGNKEREVYVSKSVGAAIDAWTAERGDWPGPMFVAFVGGAPSQRRCCADVIGSMVHRTQRAAGLARITPHDFRRTMITNALKAGGQLLAVQRMVGHASPATTSLYDRQGIEAMRAAADTLILPTVEPKRTPEK